MSDVDRDGPLEPEWFDSEADLPGISSVDSTQAMGVNVSPHPANSPVNTLETKLGNSNAMASAPYRGGPMGDAPLAGTRPDEKGENFLDTPNHTPFQSKSPSPIPFHRGWSTGRGRELGLEGGGVVLHYTTPQAYRDMFRPGHSRNLKQPLRTYCDEQHVQKYSRKAVRHALYRQIFRVQSIQNAGSKCRIEVVFIWCIQNFN